VGIGPWGSARRDRPVGSSQPGLDVASWA
jgi:hypothetical protein